MPRVRYVYLWADGRKFHMSKNPPDNEWIVPEKIEVRGSLKDNKVWLITQINLETVDEKGRPRPPTTYRWVVGDNPEPYLVANFATKYKVQEFKLE